LLKADKSNHPLAALFLGIMYQEGYFFGVSKDLGLAKTYSNKLKDSLWSEEECGKGFERYCRGLMYYWGIGVPKNHTEAIKHFRQAATEGYALAHVNLGRSYRRGHGVPKDEKMSFSHYKQAADQGNAVGQFLLGNAYRSGIGVSKDLETAVIYLKKAADQGNPNAQEILGWAYSDKSDWKNAEDFLQQAVDQGSATAQYGLAQYYFYHKPYASKENMFQAFALYEQAASKGMPNAIRAVASQLVNYEGAPVNGKQEHVGEAVKLLQKIANTDSLACLQLGKIYKYQYENTTPKKEHDKLMAIEYFRRAAAGGEVSSTPFEELSGLKYPEYTKARKQRAVALLAGLHERTGRNSAVRRIDQSPLRDPQTLEIALRMSFFGATHYLKPDIKEPVAKPMSEPDKPGPVSEPAQPNNSCIIS